MEHARKNIRLAQQRQAQYVDTHRRKIVFKEGDQVLLSTDHLKLIGINSSITPKFAAKFIGPFKVLKAVNDNAYELELPTTLEIHPVINIECALLALDSFPPTLTFYPTSGGRNDRKIKYKLLVPIRSTNNITNNSRNWLHW